MRALTLAGAVLALLAGTAAAASAAELSIDYYVNSEGTGLLIANGGDGPVTWEGCTDVCTPRDDGDGNPQTLRVADDPAGSVFKATRGAMTVVSEPWRGRLVVQSPPTLEGELRVGGFVRPLAATWGGGWGRESDWLQLQACSTPEGADCKVILDQIKFGLCQPGGGRVLPQRYEGSWLRVVDARIGDRQPFTTEGYLRPEGVRPNPPAAGVAAATIGRIGPGPAPPGDCGSENFAGPNGPSGPAGPTGPTGPTGPAPRVPRASPAIRPSATLRRVVVRVPGRRLVAARVRCAVACRVELRARQGRLTVRITRSMPAGGGAVALPRAAARRLLPGPIGMRVRVNGRVVAERRATLRGRA